MTTLFLVEDDVEVRSALRASIESKPEFAVPIAVGTCREIREALRKKAPDVLLIDLGLPDGCGLDIIAEAAARYPRLHIMVITVFGDERRVIAAIKAGATGYLLKDDSGIDVASSIQQLLEGGSPISPSIARQLFRVFKDAPTSPATSATTLTAREQEVLRLAAKGYSYGEIARLLSLSSNTIASYTKYIYEKLSVNSRSEAVYEAERLGLLHRT